MSKRTAPFPTKEQVADFIRESPTPVGKREVARAFQISGNERVALKAMLKELESEGTVTRGRGRKMGTPHRLPEVAVLQVASIDADGEVVARPVTWDEEEPPPRIYMAPERRGHPALGEGDRVLARLRRLSDSEYEGRTIKRLDRRAAARVVGVFEGKPGGGIVRPADRKQKESFFVADIDRHGAQDGELVVVEQAASAGRFGPRRATVIERLGDPDHPSSISLIAIHAAGIPVEFPAEALSEAEAAAASPVGLGGREDLRDRPLVTIDGADARDFDDAVWAEADPDPGNAGGWRLIVAIADVAHFVRPSGALDREAYRRGNSCYFPDRVVPMLPEVLSNGVCSLRPAEERACLAAHLTVDRHGELKRFRFARALMRSAARLTYEQVQAAQDGTPDAVTAPLMDRVVQPLYGAFRALSSARARRGTLDLDIPEHRVRLDENGRVAAIEERSRLDSHRLIEELMIAANVAAASAMQERTFPCLFRVHDAPDKAKLQALREFLEPLGYRVAKGQVPQPRMFTQLLHQAADRPEAPIVNELILRCQAQALYEPHNIGHFGLALPRYTHFTSPIRRYADLTVHRGLIRLLKLGDGGALDEELQRLGEVGGQVSSTERRAIAAERDAVDRYVAAFLADRIGETFRGRVSGVTRFGLFVRLEGSGADGLVPIGTLPDDYYRHDERRHALVGDRTRREFRLGASLEVELIEADPISGSTVFRLVGDFGPPRPSRRGERRERTRGPA